MVSPACSLVDRGKFRMEEELGRMMLLISISGSVSVDCLEYNDSDEMVQ